MVSSNQDGTVGGSAPVLVSLPPSFLCPLSMQLMEEPMMDHDGHNFEKKAILDWIIREGNSICPISHKPLESSDLVPNVILKESIRQWRDHHPRHPLLSVSASTDTSSSSLQAGSPPVPPQQQQDLSVLECNSDHDHNEDENSYDQSRHQTIGKRMELAQAITSHSLVLAANEEEDSCRSNDQSHQHDTNANDDRMELGQAITSLSMVLAAHEGYLDLDSGILNQHAEENEMLLSVEDQLLLKCELLPASTMLRRDASSLYTMLLPQEREALENMQQRAREQRQAKRLSRLIMAGLGVSAVFVSLIFVLYLIKIVRSFLQNT